MDENNTQVNVTRAQTITTNATIMTTIISESYSFDRKLIDFSILGNAGSLALFESGQLSIIGAPSPSLAWIFASGILIGFLLFLALAVRVNMILTVIVERLNKLISDQLPDDKQPIVGWEFKPKIKIVIFLIMYLPILLLGFGWYTVLL